jgi:hypothetical protein
VTLLYLLHDIYLNNIEQFYIHLVSSCLTTLLSSLITSYRKGSSRGNAQDLYSGGAQFDFQSEHRLFRGLPQSLQSNSRIVPGLGPDRFLLNPFQFIVHQSFYHPTLCSLDTGSVAK